MATIYFDGSCKPGETLKTCTVVDSGVPVVKSWSMRRHTSGRAEWLAAREAAKIALKLGLADVEIVGDYENAILHMRGVATLRKPDNRKTAAQVRVLLRGHPVPWRHVPRDRNPAGLHLESLG